MIEIRGVGVDVLQFRLEDVGFFLFFYVLSVAGRFFVNFTVTANEKPPDIPG